MKHWKTSLGSNLSRSRAGVALGSILAISLLLWAILRPAPLPDFKAIEDVPSMKQAFNAYLRPIVMQQNQQIENQRQNLDALAVAFDQTGALGAFQRWRLRSLASNYEVEWNDDIGEVIKQLKLRVDAVPVELALAQAAKESGWGRSRFAIEGNNLFGLWCYKPGCGLVPQRRPEGETHEVAAFSSVSAAVEYYLHNINTHDGYADLRRRRLQLRESGKRLNPLILAEGLLLYSQRREAYVQEIKAMVRQFQGMPLPSSA